MRSSADDERWLRRWVLPHLGARVVSELDAVAVAAWVGALVAEGLAPRSVRNAHHLLSMLLEHAVDVGLLPRNVAAARCLPAGTLPAVERGARADVDGSPSTWTSSGSAGSAAGSAVGRGAAEPLTGPDRVRRAVVELREAAETVRREGGLTAADFLEGRAVQLDIDSRRRDLLEDEFALLPVGKWRLLSRRDFVDGFDRDSRQARDKYLPARTQPLVYRPVVPEVPGVCCSDCISAARGRGRQNHDIELQALF